MTCSGPKWLKSSGWGGSLWAQGEGRLHRSRHIRTVSLKDGSVVRGNRKSIQQEGTVQPKSHCLIVNWAFMVWLTENVHERGIVGQDCRSRRGLPLRPWDSKPSLLPEGLLESLTGSRRPSGSIPRYLTLRPIAWCAARVTAIDASRLKISPSRAYMVLDRPRPPRKEIDQLYLWSSFKFLPLKTNVFTGLFWL